MLQGDPHATFNQLVSSNPSFARFVRENAGKSSEQLASEYGIDIGLVRQIAQMFGRRC